MQFCHFLIGIPGSGKSRLAQILATLGDYTLISTDKIRQDFYGDEIIQGDWFTVEQAVLQQARASIAQGKPIIYDATNVQQDWRVQMLEQMPPGLAWVAWHLQTPLELCLAWNQQRDRKIPPEVIESMNRRLLQTPPQLSEGFVEILQLSPEDCTLQGLRDRLHNLQPR